MSKSSKSAAIEREKVEEDAPLSSKVLEMQKPAIIRMNGEKQGK